MSELAAVLARIEALETRVAHQDRVIEDLNATVTRQWGALDAALRQVALLDDRLQDAEARGSGAPQPPPPHY